jgi:hypothetical protein
MKENTNFAIKVFGLRSNRTPLGHFLQGRNVVHHSVEPFLSCRETTLALDILRYRIEIIKSAQAASGGTKRKRNSADLAAGSESVLREFIKARGCISTRKAMLFP